MARSIVNPSVDRTTGKLSEIRQKLDDTRASSSEKRYYKLGFLQADILHAYGPQTISAG
ncbi:hypothetical protein F443_14076 [Phytophthora nicotianae P1569]|uniref:Uncharacterized protein n=1 Tax=Phytophthora nicotianae P1569 TaxID=1317065 RepID=V9ER32_PHYNI|nr:hypothetical protein F443_14076 [Phytophthora nicotianae P1569]